MMSMNLIDRGSTPQVTGLEYEEMRDLKLHPEKSGQYEALVKHRTAFGRDFETKAPRKKRRRRTA